MFVFLCTHFLLLTHAHSSILVLVVFRSSKCAKENDKLCRKEAMPACWQEKDVPVLQQQITKCYKFMYVIVYSDCPGDCCPEKDCCG